MSGALAAGASAAPPVNVSVVASGLNSPKHLTWTDDGLLVTESGTGGPVGTSNCVTAPPLEGPGTTQYCEGATGSVALVRDGHTDTVLGGLPSVVEEDTGEALGVSAVAPLQTGLRGFWGGWQPWHRYGSGLAVLFQDELVDSDGTNGLSAPASTVFGTLQLGPWWSAEIAKFAAENPQNPATLGGIPGVETTYDSDPFDVIDYGRGYVVVDAAANSLLYVSPHGQISLLARFPTQLEDAPAGVFGPGPVPIEAQAVPTAVAVGPDGALYVSQLVGVPSNPGTSDIFRVVPGQAPTVWATGLTAVTAIAFDRHGRLLATEYSTGGLLAPPTVPGALVEVSQNGTQVTTLPVSGLYQPTGVAVAPDGSVYVANYGTSPGSAATPGEVVRITGLG
jgi:glucose/arabinose dehydrogenase